MSAIAHFTTFEEIAKLRDNAAHKLRQEIAAMSMGSTDATEYGARVFDGLAELRWKIDALDYVLSGWEQKTEEEFHAIRRGIARDLIAQAGGGGIADRYNPPAYWKTLRDALDRLECANDRLERAKERMEYTKERVERANDRMDYTKEPS